MKLLGLFALLIAATLPATAAPIDIGPALGSTVPALSATGLDGKPVSIKSLSGRRGVVLLFVRSAKWCPYCQKQLIEFRAAQAPLAAQGYTLAALSYDPPEVLARFAEQRQIGYSLLSDPKSATIDAFQLRDPQYKPDSMAFGVPKPAIFVISRKGVVEAKLAEEGYKVRPPVETVLAAIGGLKR